MTFFLPVVLLSCLSFMPSFYYLSLLVSSVVFFSLTFCYSFSQSLSFTFYSDDVSLLMIFMLCCVTFLSSFWCLRLHSPSASYFLLAFMFFLCGLLFSTSSLLVLYISYEISLLPIILIIIIWGSYSERSLSSIMLLIYTSIFTIPFILVIFFIFSCYNTFTFAFITSPLSAFISLLLFSVFAVKLPVYGLHFWLPMAHVEAPTFGSILLAGVLLKLGGVGLIRCYPLIDWSFIGSSLISYFFVFLLYATLVCCFQSDFKRLVAYSSVSHMIVVPLVLFSYTMLGSKCLILVLLFHGFSSPLLFSVVGYFYSLFISRQLLLIRGLALLSPLLSVVLIIGFIFTLCVPPFPSYLAEVLFFVSSLTLWDLSPLVLVSFSFLSLVYNLNWMSSSVFFAPSHSLRYSCLHWPYSYFFSMAMFILVGLTFIFLFPYV